MISLSRGINNLTVKTKEINIIKTKHNAIEIEIEKLCDKNRSQTSHFRTQGANWDEWCKLLDKNLSQFISSFPNEVCRSIIDDQANLFVNITGSASRFFGVAERSKKNKVKGGGVRIQKTLEVTLAMLTIDTRKGSNLPT